ncbi:putative aryl-alcohol dehydrogenase aad14 [Exophiala xenobiotica]|uniref:Aldo-keto reductase ausK n=1 Tax=Vermiconidia calcicola TaxID=1690605 RepID=A0AAV9PVH0_9PEZI|nr:putative aryl-alcohol dehydrogenase aad14 [Exophiala xenobiotica]KAK5530394.1 putative aryl-alcohol dehydrogenase aad14 [Vermiconidia calcicola]KAK5532675.1 putative aryl-alcohol dehydrogenase aad14 [Chaetothyriales sp. CCFEE 6169]KAK5216860.1 putative aryl-alcohol dehydrogenase aad14 [Exophiala xenobiotica]KAK5230564.1 putative aryl-alcohol dehydrogenase aad14 [Exophiala xenobiotica]
MSDFFAPAPEPPTELGRYRVLSSTAGVRVSPLCLGAMSIGDAWSGFMGSMSKENSFKLLDAFYEAGGNFIDTANNYQDEQSEKWIGEWMATKKNRDMMVIATKFTTAYRSYDLGKGKTVNYSGNHKKSLHLSVNDSLKKLQTDYIDLLYLHWWDWTTSIEEVMDSLHILVEQGKVLYLGISDTPAWIVSAANTYARSHGKTPFSVYQGRWNIMLRDFERDIIPMARHFGMALCPWDVIGGGKFQSKKQIEARKKQGEGLRSMISGDQSPQEEKISAALEKVAGEHGLESLSAIALAYVMQKTPNVFPIIGGRKVEHLHDNIKALSIKLTDEQIKFLESQTNFDVGFPSNFVGESPKATGQSSMIVATTAKIAYPIPERPFAKEG